MSALSAKTYSCGGEAGRFFLVGGGEAEALGLKNRSKPPFAAGLDVNSSSLMTDGADESDDSSEDMVIVVGC